MCKLITTLKKVFFAGNAPIAVSNSKSPLFEYMGRVHEMETAVKFSLLRVYELKGKLEAEHDGTGDTLERTVNSAMAVERRRLVKELEECRAKLNGINF